ncbi:MAG: pilin [Candidatus Altiarchaeota archaeon]|nr:pilin [Candidatus Altiarchaeota archaeon]
MVLQQLQVLFGKIANMKSKTILACLALTIAFYIFASEASAGTACMLPWGSPGPGEWGSFDDVRNGMTLIGASLAFILFVYQGMKWMVAEGPEDREDAKKGIIYLVIGMLLLVCSYSLVYFLLCG